MLAREGIIGTVWRSLRFWLAIALMSACVCYQGSAKAETFSNYNQVASSDLPSKVLKEVIAREGKSKSYTDLLPLDGGTIGIANFARGGLRSLYEEMDTEKYFGRSRGDMISGYSDKCRPTGKYGNDTGWGCYSKSWWRDGMARFLSSPESVEIQNRAWMKLMRPAVEAALAHGWTTGRSLAIAMGITNSLGGAGFQSLAAKNSWKPEQTLSAYVGTNAHRARRRDALNAAFPLT